MFTIEISNRDPNQSFSVTLNKNKVDIRLCTFRSTMFADIVINGVSVCSGRRVINRMPLLPKRYERLLGGNLGVISSSGDYPVYFEIDNSKNALVFDGEIVNVY